MQDRHHVVVVGGGFGGVQLVKGLAGAPVRITLIDRRNHHLFQPLLYQVATTLIATSEIAWPLRSLWRDRGRQRASHQRAHGYCGRPGRSSGARPACRSGCPCQA